VSTLGSTSFDDLDRLSSAELRHRAVDAARERHDVRFFWRLFESIPEAKMISGHLADAYADVEDAGTWFDDFVKSDGTLDDALRPVYIDYLQHHPGAERGGDRSR
jgi:hypothetical protein